MKKRANPKTKPGSPISKTKRNLNREEETVRA